MALYALVPSGWEEVSQPWVLTPAGWQAVQNAYVLAPSGWELFYSAGSGGGSGGGGGLPPLTASISPNSVSGFCTTRGAGCTASQTVNCVPSGGSGTYTFEWSYVSGATGFTLTGQGTGSATFSAYEAADTQQTAVWQCTVNDGDGNTASATVTVTLQSININ